MRSHSSSRNFDMMSTNSVPQQDGPPWPPSTLNGAKIPRQSAFLKCSAENGVDQTAQQSCDPAEQHDGQLGGNSIDFINHPKNRPNIAQKES